VALASPSPRRDRNGVSNTRTNVALVDVPHLPRADTDVGPIAETEET
jgi:hypothetical protein